MLFEEFPLGRLKTASHLVKILVQMTLLVHLMGCGGPSDRSAGLEMLLFPLGSSNLHSFSKISAFVSTDKEIFFSVIF